MTEPWLPFLAIKAGYASCGAAGATLAVAVTPTTIRATLVRLVCGFFVCFCFATPLLAHLELTDDPHHQIAANGLLGFLSWYLLNALDRFGKYATNEQNVRDFVLKRLGVDAPRSEPPITPTPPRPLVGPPQGPPRGPPGECSN